MLTITKARQQALGLGVCKEDCMACDMCSSADNGTLCCDAMPGITIDVAIQRGYDCPEIDEGRLREEMTEEEYYAYRHNALIVAE